MSNWLDRAKRALESGSFLAHGRLNCRPNPHRRKFTFEELEPRLTLAAAGLITTPQTYSGVLNDKIVFTSGGHGWQWNTTLGRYATDRGDNNEIIEDFGNQEQMSFYADYALRAGATVVPLRPVGRQINEVVLDNDSASVTYTGSWSNSTGTQYYDEDYGASADSVSYRFASTVTGTETATATYLPNIPQAGFYPVYTWVFSSSNRTEQTYRVNHTGGSTEITVDHRKVGKGWVYLGTYHFNAGSSATGEGSVQIINKSPVSGVVIADAIRFGNGMGDWVDTPTGAPGISGYPREDENSFHWIARSVGIGTSLTTATGASSNNNVSAPSNYAQYMFSGTFGEAVYIGFHSNAGGGRGARGLIDADVAEQTPHQAGTNGLADILGDQINQDMQNLNGVFEYNWTAGTTSTFTGQFGEINLGSGAEMDATIIEVAFHDSVEDAAIMRDPNGRDQIARSTLQGTVQYFSLYGSPVVANTNLPSAPTNVRAVSNASGAVTLNWAAGASSPASVHGNAATGYKVYSSVDGYGFDGGRVVAGVGTTTLTITGLDPNTPYYFKVAATNAGGESTGTEVVAALPSGGAKQVLIVNGFDRYDRTQNFRYAYAFTGDGLVDRVWPRWNNSFDYINRVERSLQAAKPGVHVASTSNEAVISGAVDLTDYDVVVWILGNESTADDTFNATEQTKVTQFLAAGGNLFVSGAEIGWDLDQQNNGRTFFENTLKGNYVADDAGVYTANVSATPGIFNGLSNFAFSSGASSTVYSSRDDQVYDVATPDVIAPQTGAATSLTYSTNSAGIQVGTGGIGTGSIVMWGFPVETMTNETRRQQALGRVLDFLGADLEIETRVNGQDADSPTGPILVPGGSLSLTYLVTNPGIVSLPVPVVVDDNGTPGTTGDDFSPTFTGGDTNGNNQIDVGETWTYTSTRTVVAGGRTHTGKATTTNSTTTIIKTDAGNYFGSAPAVALQTSVNGDDADSPPGPTLASGSSATFDYVLTNTGNVAVSSVVVVDDNGTPGNAGDDFNPTFTGGDTNSNNILDLGETWTFTAVRTVIAGQYTHTSSASGLDSINQLASGFDPTSYFAPANADFNSDTNIDALDYVIWRKNSPVTSGALQSQGDANGDGAVDGSDYNIWRSQFGMSLAASATTLTAIATSSLTVADSQEPRFTLAAAGLVTAPQTYSGTLSGKIVFTSGGHGWKGSGTSYTVDRPEYWQDKNAGGVVIDSGQLVEDFGNQDQLTFYADYLLRGGATVVPMRPVGRQAREVVLDNDSVGVTYTGSWSDSTTAAAAPRYYDEDYGAVADSVRYRNSSIAASETATATYTPNIPAAGFYPVYTWVASSANRTNQLYKINHTGGQTEIRVDHRLVGMGWVYLGTYHFNSGSSTTEGSVIISNQSTDGGSVVIADAIRFGNGMGDYIESGATVISGKPREDENSYHWIARMIGQGTTLSEAIGSGSSNVSAPSNMAQWMLSGTYDPANNNVDAVYVGFHSNGTTGQKATAVARGARGLIDNTAPTPHQGGTNGLALLLGNQINQDMQSINLNYPGTFEHNWTTSTTSTFTSAFGEIDLGSSAEMDATIIEVAFHDTVTDNALLRDPKVRDQIARSVYQGTLQYFSIYGGATNTSLPTPPTNVRAISNASGEVTINWSAGLNTPTGVYGAAATGFKVYASIDGYGFDGGTTVAGGGATSVTLSGYDPNTPYYFKVAATNAGGESKASEVVTAIPTGGVKQILIVNGFDRYDRSQNFRYAFVYPENPDGLTDRVWSRYNNSFDYVVQVATAIQASKPGVHFASTSNEAVVSGAVSLTDYDAVIWILGNESTVDETFSLTEQTKVVNFINAGGNLFLSGSEIAWDLDRADVVGGNNPTAADRSFFQTTLKATYSADDAGTYTATADAAGIFSGMSSFGFSSGAPSTGASAYNTLDGQVYDVAFPDVLVPQSGAVSALTYSGGTGGTAAIQLTGTGGQGNIVMFGFPFETMSSAARRQTAMGKILDFFGVAAQNADFNSDAMVDGGDYVIWRKGNGITSGAVHGQGDANGDGAVDGTDYSIWRAQYSTIVGAGTAIAAGDAAAVSVAGSSTSMTVATSPMASSSNRATSPKAALARQAAFGQLYAGAIEHRATERGNIAALRPAIFNESHQDWRSLLSILANPKTEADVTEQMSPSAEISRMATAESRIKASQLSTNVGTWRMATAGL